MYQNNKVEAFQTCSYSNNLESVFHPCESVAEKISCQNNERRSVILYYKLANNKKHQQQPYGHIIPKTL